MPAAAYTLEWTFTPVDYFDREFRIDGPDYCAWFALGKVTATVDQEVYEHFNPDVRVELEKAIRSRFDGAQLVSRRPYKLDGPARFLLHPDGRRDVFIEVGAGVVTLTGGSVDVRITDPTGAVVHDTKAERAADKANVGELLHKHRDRDDTLRAIATSHANAVTDPNNELVHLYEIREALQGRFRNESKARSALGVAQARWSRFGQLCNDEPLRQGRHRGKFAASVLRDATEAELSEARSISTELVRSYLTYLDTLPPKP